MKFCLLDRITLLEPNVRITAVKRLRPEEEYLKDHFPRFPVMPGVLMLEAMFQAGAWLILGSDDFAYPLILMKEARNVKYADFVTPGKELTVSVEIVKTDNRLVTLKAEGAIGDKTAVTARLLVEKQTVGELFPARTQTDQFARHTQRELLAKLCRGTLAPAT